MTRQRLEAFSDGIFAIVATLLVLDLRLPDVSDGQLLSALRAMAPRLLTYVVSFALVGVYWVAHHGMLGFVARVDRRLLWMNNLVLLLVALLPFPTALLGSHPRSPIAVAAYGGTLASVNVAGALLWAVAVRRKLVAANLPAGFSRFVGVAHLSPALVYAAGVAVGQRWPQAGIVIFALVPLAFILPNPPLERRLDEAERLVRAARAE